MEQQFLAKHERRSGFDPAGYASELLKDLAELEQRDNVDPALSELYLIANGFSIYTTALARGISESEVENRLMATRKELSARNNPQAIAAAIKARKLPLLSEVEAPRRALTNNELRVLLMAIKGKKIKETAKSMKTSQQSVKDFRRYALRKLGARNTSQAVYLAFSSGVLSFPDQSLS